MHHSHCRVACVVSRSKRRARAGLGMAWSVQAAVAAWLVQAAAGLNHQTNCVLTLSGDVKCWGHCYPYCGIGAIGYVGKSSGDMGSNTPGPNLGTGANGTAVGVCSSRKSSCALFENGGVKCWGDGASGQLGYGKGFNGGMSMSQIQAGEGQVQWVEGVRLAGGCGGGEGR